MEATNAPGAFPVEDALLANQIHLMHSTPDAAERAQIKEQLDELGKFLSHLHSQVQM